MTTSHGGSGDPGSPGGGTTSICTRLIAGLWGFWAVLATDGSTPTFELTSPPVGSCREWNYTTTAGNTNDNGYGSVIPDNPDGTTTDGRDFTVYGIAGVSP